MSVQFIRSSARFARQNPAFSALMAFNLSVIGVCALPQVKRSLPAPELPKPTKDVYTRSRPITDYLGPAGLKASFLQGKTGDCYVLSSLDAVQHHPHGKSILDGVRVMEEDHWPDEPNKTYTVCFPTGEQATIYSYELGLKQGEQTPVRGPEAIQLLELAFAKLSAAERNRNKRFASQPYPDEGRGHELALVRGGIPVEVMRRLFTGQERADVHRCYDDPDELRQRLAVIGRDCSQQHVLCALIIPGPKKNKDDEDGFIELPPRDDGQARAIQKFYRSHSFSIREIHPNGTVTVADPHNTATKVDVLTMREFGHVFDCLSGMRFKTPEKSHRKA